MKEFDSCFVCPRNCGVNRNDGEKGFCGAGSNMRIARFSLHLWEEPCISGATGSGTIFFSHCNLKCLFCQNYEISTRCCGKEVSVEELAQICLRLQEKGATNINLVTPTHFIPCIREGILLAKKKGLHIPIVYNTSGYESVESLRTLEGLIDIYLPDFKYYDEELARNFSHAPSYFEVCRQAISEMVRQVGSPVFEGGLMKRGVIVRHLLLPSHLEDSKKIVEYLWNTYHEKIYFSLMNQYTPLREIKKYPELNRTVTEEEYDALINFACDLGIVQAFIQEGETQKESFIPDFAEFDGTISSC